MGPPSPPLIYPSLPPPPQALKTTYHVTKRYIEVDVDISANTVANYATGMCRGSANSLVIDMGEWT